MEIKKLPVKVTEFIKKNKYITLIIVLGLVFMLLPTKNESKTETEAPLIDSVDQAPETSVEEELSAILKRIEGAGNVEVMLTIAKGEEILFQTNEELTTDNDTSKQRNDTITVTDANKNQTGLVRQRIPPVYLGAIIVCQGADDPSVKLAITEAVSKITGLKSNHISVLKMK